MLMYTVLRIATVTLSVQARMVVIQSKYMQKIDYLELDDEIYCPVGRPDRHQYQINMYANG